ncbi:MAG: DUF4433 domain-containing protein [Chloroflexota bacterium]|nr:DUF4433 domain-containing protein [Chloroflexota bacterium]
MLVPTEPKLYHIVHVDRLSAIASDGYLWCDGEIAARAGSGTTIGMSKIKQRRLEELTLASHPGLHVGDCVPFYFCPRSVMLYVISMRNSPELAYSGGQGPIVHLELDLQGVVAWADFHGLRWAFTASNAGSYHFDDYADLKLLNKIDWDAVGARKWAAPAVKEGKQAEFLVEQSVPWELVSRVGVRTVDVRSQVLQALHQHEHRPSVEVKPDWYY